MAQPILIKNGRIWDGERFFYGDVLTEGDKISRMESEITCEKAFVYDAAGKIVSAGLIDPHIHARGLSSTEHAISPEAVSFPFGVTAVAEAYSNFGDQRTVEQWAVKAVVFAGSKIENNHLDREVTAARIAQYGDKTIGIKMSFDSTSRHIWDITPLQEACALARERGLKMLVHCNHSPAPMAEIVETLAPGDILTHVYHGGGNTCLEADFAALQLAREEGITLDAGFAGHIHTDFGVMRTAFEAGYFPDTISTDITCSSAFRRGGRYGLSMAMSMARTAGMEETEILRAVTSAAAASLGMGDQWGRLKPGGTADIAVLEYADEGFDLTDKAGNRLASREGYRCLLTVCDGQIVYRH